MPAVGSMPEKRGDDDPFLYRSQTEDPSTLLPMLIGGLVLIVVCMVAVMIFVRG